MNEPQITLARAHASELTRQHGRPAEIVLTLYETDHDLRILRPEDGPEATCADHASLIHAVADALRADGHTVTLRPMRASDYLRYLAATGQKNSPETRAKFTTT